MDDLLDLDWQKSSSSSTSRNGATLSAATTNQRSASPNIDGSSSAYSSYSFDALTRALPSSSSSPSKLQNRSAQPLRPTQTQAASASKATSVGNDAFSSLLSFGGSASTPSAANSHLTLADQQRASTSRSATPSARQDVWQADAGWDAFEQSSGPTRTAPGPPGPSQKSRPRDPFDFDASLDFEQPSSTTRKPAQAATGPSDPFDFADFDGPEQSTLGQDQYNHADDSDDFLGALGRPVEPKATQPASKQPASSRPPRPPSPPPHLLGQIVEMGFSPQEARQALARTKTGLDVEAALESLLHGQRSTEDQDHELAMRLQQDEEQGGRDFEMEEYEERERQRRAARRGKSVAKGVSGDSLAPPGSMDSPSRKSPRNPSAPRSAAASGTATPLDEIDWQKQADQLYSTASELGASVFSKANAFWSSAKAQAAKTLEEQRQSGRATPATSEAAGASGSGRSSPATDSVAAAKAWARRWGNQPKPSERKEWEGKPRWMVEAEEADRRQTDGDKSVPDATESAAGFKDSDNEDEPAAPFVSSAGPPRPRVAHTPKTSPPTAVAPAGDIWDTEVPVSSAKATSAPAPPTREPAAAAAPKPYVSSARWGKAKTTQASTSAAASTSASSKTQPPAAQLPSRDLDSSDLSPAGRSASLKSQGNEAFKKGSYGEAEGLYTQALDSLGGSSLRRIPLLNNRAQSRLKNGEARGAMEDCSAVVALVLSNDVAAGDSQQATTVMYRASLDPTLPGSLSSEVVLRDAYSKALLRRAQAAEALEKWAGAQSDWLLLERFEKEQGSSAKEGFKNLTAARDGKARCESMLSGGKKKATASVATRRPPARKAATQPAVVRATPSVQLPDDSEERLALKDSIESRIASWTAGGKESNIRALLTSLDTVLWPELGWKKVQMSEVLTDGQIKKVYWRAIGKCHPDKIKRDETLERRMLAAGVFGVLNEAFAASQK